MEKTRILCLLAIVLLPWLVSRGEMRDADSTKKTFSYMPQIHGLIKTRYEYEPATRAGRFQVRNARLDLQGHITSWAGYRLHADFCNRGKFEVLDAYVEFTPSRQFTICAGQMRIPFSYNANRPTSKMWFTTKSYINTQVGSTRDVGLKAKYQLAKLPLWFEGGVFNADKMTNHEVWEKELSYAGRVGCKFGNVELQAGSETVYPDSVRITHYDIAVHWEARRWQVEGEYMFTAYAHGAYSNGHGYYIAANYALPVHWGQINRLSFQGRYDGMNDYSTGYRNAQGKLSTTFRERQRVTLGATISYIGSAVRCDFRINGNIMMYPSGTQLAVGDHSQLVAEVVLRF